jgi:hypothetical protein
MGLQLDSTQNIITLLESVYFSEEGSIVKYCNRVWGNHEIGQVAYNVFK